MSRHIRRSESADEGDRPTRHLAILMSDLEAAVDRGPSDRAASRALLCGPSWGPRRSVDMRRIAVMHSIDVKDMTPRDLAQRRGEVERKFQHSAV